MKRIQKSMILLLLLVSSLSISGVFADSTSTFDVNVTSYFEETIISNTVNDASTDSKLTIDNALSNESGFQFAYYVVNNIVRENLDLNYEFTISSNMDISVYYTPTDSHIVLFVDADGTLLDAVYVQNGESVSDSGVTIPSNSSGWDGSLSTITSNTILTLQYEADPITTYTYSIVDGSYTLNEEVTVTAPLINNDRQFSHFEENGQIISRNNSIVITLFEDRTLNAVYTSKTVSNAPFVSLSNDMKVTEGFSTFMANYYVSEDFTLIEQGMISFDGAEFNLQTADIEKQTFEVSSTTNKYTSDFDQSVYNYVRAFMTFKDDQDNTYTIYSDTKACGNVSQETLFYETDIEDGSKSSYASGSVSLNDKTWTLNEALIGSLDNDQRNGSQSIRMRAGYLKSEFTVSNISKISFYHGRYLSDDANSFDLEISTDGSNWISLDSQVASDTFQYYEFILDNSVYEEKSLDSNAEYYIRINHTSGERINIDDIKIYHGGISNGNNPTLETSLQTPIMKLSVSGFDEDTYTVGDDFPGVCLATDMISGSVTCSITGYNMALAGTYTVTFSAIDFEGNVHTSTTTLIVEAETDINLDLEQYLTIDYVGYYDGIEGLYGEDLMDALRAIIQNGFIAQSYGDSRYALDYIDADPNNSDNVLLIYNRDSVSGVWDSGVTWNREHVWPNSRLGVERVDNSDKTIASDYHNLRACDSGLNSTRNNDIYTDSSSSTFYPGVDDQGDVARILFYMATMYPQLTLTDEATSKFIDGDAYTLEGALMGDLEDLLTWNLIDVPDYFEITRNNRIEEYQNNRNPFIDYPYLAELIWNYETTN